MVLTNYPALAAYLPVTPNIWSQLKFLKPNFSFEIRTNISEYLYNVYQSIKVSLSKQTTCIAKFNGFNLIVLFYVSNITHKKETEKIYYCRLNYC